MSLSVNKEAAFSDSSSRLQSSDWLVVSLTRQTAFNKYNTRRHVYGFMEKPFWSYQLGLHYLKSFRLLFHNLYVFFTIHIHTDSFPLPVISSLTSNQVSGLVGPSERRLTEFTLFGA